MAAIDSFKGEHSYLSNFHPSIVSYKGRVYPTVEHAFQAQKTLDEAEQISIQMAPTPGSAKHKGKRVKLRDDWESVKLDIMHDLLRLKFQDQGLKQQLVATYGLDLIEGNTWNDRFWGVCNGVGKNHLGRLLMLVREEIVLKELGSR